MRDSKNHFLMIDEVRKRPKKKCGAENRKTQTLLQATIFQKFDLELLLCFSKRSFNLAEVESRTEL
jgi:hypothetical protein